MNDPAALIEADGLTRDYGDLRAVDGVGLALHRGEVLGLLGPNGAGKTSTMQMLCGTLAPTAGRIVVDGIDLLERPRRAKAALGYLPERPPLHPELTVAEYLRFAAALRGVPRRARAGAVERVLARCGLDDTAGRLIAHLSLGYRQRVGIAQALVHEPAAIVLDEPTAGLDPVQIREIRALITELGRERGVILSTHVLPEVQAACSRVAIMHRGRIAFAAATADLAARPPARAIIGLAEPPGAQRLEAIDGVTAVEPLGPGRFRVHFAPERGGTRALAAAACANDWGLTELTPEQRSLEQVFVSVTSRDDNGGRSAGDEPA